MKTACIIGGGVIGGGWAARFLLNGWRVQVFDPDPEAPRKIGEVLDNARYALPMLYDVALPPEGELVFCDTLDAALKGATWVQESVPERLELKQKVYAQIETSGTKALIGSSTSGFKPSELQEGLNNPTRVFVTHPFNPVYLLPLIELVPSEKTNAGAVEEAKGILTDLGMHPLVVRKEIDAHIADRFLEAVWREGLWLIKDGIATTEEIDDAIRYGFGLRWGQMGLFETYRIAGGEAGMEHFISQFGPALQWPWTKLMDVPELTDELITKIAAQSDAQSGAHSIRELERMRDNNLIAMIRGLKTQNAAAGALIKAHEEQLRNDTKADFSKPLETVNRTVPADWTDYNGHMNESRYGQVFSDAADGVLLALGADAAYVDAGNSYFTVNIDINFVQEAHASQRFKVLSQIILADGKKLKLFHKMLDEADTLLATGEQFLLHVDLIARKSSEPTEMLQKNLDAAWGLQKNLSDPRD